MPSDAEVSRSAAQTYYEDFALAVGRRDWLHPNLRHVQLKGMVDELLAGRSGLRILDVGYGAGVLTHHLSATGARSGSTSAGRRSSSRSGWRRRRRSASPRWRTWGTSAST